MAEGYVRTLRILAVLVVAACTSSTDGKDTDPLEDTTGIDDPVDTDTNVDTVDPVDTDPVVPTDPEHGDLAGPTGGGGTRSSANYKLDVTVGEPLSVHERTTPNYKIQVGVGSVHQR